MASPIRAPTAMLKKNFITISKHPSDAIDLHLTKIIAAMNPSADIPNPAKNANPQISDVVKTFEEL
jgi:hypothetical protein